MVTSHDEVNHPAIQMPIQKARKALSIKKDIRNWSTPVHDAALSAKFNWHEPPGIDELPGAVLSTWANVGAYIDAGRLAHVGVHKDSVAPREKQSRKVERVSRDDDSVQLPCFGWASQRGCRFDNIGMPCKYRTDPDVKFRAEKQRGGGASGAAHKKESPVLAGCRSLPRRATDTGAARVEALLNRLRVTTNRGAGSVS